MRRAPRRRPPRSAQDHGNGHGVLPFETAEEVSNVGPAVGVDADPVKPRNLRMTRIRRPWTLVGVAFCVATAPRLGAQESTLINGRVADSETLRPVVGAFVAQLGSDQGVLTDAEGMFSLQLSSGYERGLRVSQLGYRELRTRIPEGGQGRLLNVRLVPDPIVLAGLTVLAERLAERRRGPYGVAEIRFQDELAVGSDASGYELVQRMLPFVTLCDPQTSESLCLGGRMGTEGRRRVKVCIDDRLVTPDLEETILSGVDPRGLYLVEAYGRAGEVRMYTRPFVERLAAQGMDLPPLTMSCTGPPV